MQTAGRFLNLRYKVVAVIIAVSLWSVVNFGSRTTVTVSKQVEINNPQKGFLYRVEPPEVSVTIYVVERLLTSEFLDKVKAFVDVSSLKKEGRYKLKVRTRTKVPLLIQPTAVNPGTVYVSVIKEGSDL